eukprot:759977-Hanusia_phi.AAC.4
MSLNPSPYSRNVEQFVSKIRRKQKKDRNFEINNKLHVTKSDHQGDVTAGDPPTPTDSVASTHEGPSLDVTRVKSKHAGSSRELSWYTIRSDRLHLERKQLLCGCCGFCISVASSTEELPKLQYRFESRCPMMFTQDSRFISRSEAFNYLQAQGWKAAQIAEFLNDLGVNDEGGISREDLLRAYDPTLKEYAMLHFLRQNQFYGTLAYSDNMSSPASWYEQACAHLGLKGHVRINQTGFILLVGLALHGEMNEIFSFTDLLTNLHTPRTSPDEMVTIDVVDRNISEAGGCTISLHESKVELLNLHQADLDKMQHNGEKTPSVIERSLLLESSVQARSPQDQNIRKVMGVARKEVHLQSSVSASRQKPNASVKYTDEVDAHVSHSQGMNPKVETPPKKYENQLLGMISPPGTVATALYRYEAQEDDELSISTEETLHVISKHDDGWLLVQNQSGSIGVIPGNYVKLGLKTEKKVIDPAEEISTFVQSRSASRRDDTSISSLLAQTEKYSKELETHLNSLSKAVSKQWISTKAFLPHFRSCRRNITDTKNSIAEIRKIIEEKSKGAAKTRANNHSGVSLFEDSSDSSSDSAELWRPQSRSYSVSYVPV